MKVLQLFENNLLIYLIRLLNIIQFQYTKLNKAIKVCIIW